MSGTVEIIDIQFNKNINHQLFVVIWHRNHLGVMSGFPLQLSGDTYSFDFTSSDDHAYNFGQKEIAINVWAMTGGDANSDDIIT